jgi:hypothetical protein
VRRRPEGGKLVVLEALEGTEQEQLCVMSSGCCLYFVCSALCALCIVFAVCMPICARATSLNSCVALRDTRSKSQTTTTQGRADLR